MDAGEIAVPTLLSTLAICIVFVPVFLLQGTAKYLFSPLSLSVCLSLLASLALSFTLVPVLFEYLSAFARRRFMKRNRNIPRIRSPGFTTRLNADSAHSEMHIVRR